MNQTLKSALEEWLRGPDHKQALLDQAGALKNDDSLPALRDAIHAERGRSERDDSPES